MHITDLPANVAVDIIKWLPLRDLLQFMKTCRWAQSVGGSDAVQHYVKFDHLEVTAQTERLFDRAAYALNMQACAKLAVHYMYERDDAEMAAYYIRLLDMAADAPVSYVLLRQPWTAPTCIKGQITRMIQNDTNLNTRHSVRIINTVPFQPAAHSKVSMDTTWTIDKDSGEYKNHHRVRTLTVVWIFEVLMEAHGNELGIDAACLAAALMDRYTENNRCWHEFVKTYHLSICSHGYLNSDKVQIIASACILLASRMLAEDPLSLGQVSHYTDHSCSKIEIINMLGTVLGSIGSNVHTRTDCTNDPAVRMVYLRIVIVTSFLEMSPDRMNLLATWIALVSNHQDTRHLGDGRTIEPDMLVFYRQWQPWSYHVEKHIGVLADWPLASRLDMAAALLTGPST